MLGLLAIRLLEGCYDYIRKCLKEGAFYYFCDRYSIIEEDVITRNKYCKPQPRDLFVVNGSLHILIWRLSWGRMAREKAVSKDQRTGK